MSNIFSKRDKAILIGLYLSKFDEDGLGALGFQGFTQAYNTLGYSIGFKPTSIKNYRDEFDPYFPNKRKGWHKRVIRDYCKIFLDEFSPLKINAFTDLVKSFVIDDYDIEKIVVMNFIEKPNHQLFFDPLSSRLTFKKVERKVTQINYSTSV